MSTSLATTLKDMEILDPASVIKEQTGVVLYVDGSAIPNPGFIGSGIHGYFYTTVLEEGKKDPMARDHHVTDRGYVHPKNKKPTHKYVRPIAYLDGIIAFKDIGTNNIAELVAFRDTLKELKELNLGTIDFFTDSEYVMMGVNERCKYWERNDWKDKFGNTIKNLEIWQQTWRLIQEVRATGAKVHVGWVKGHNNVLGNVEADSLASTARNHSKYQKLIGPKFVISPVKNYWSPSIDTHPFLHHKHLYINTSQRFDVPGRYFIADDAAGGLVLGSRKPETGFCVLQMKEEFGHVKMVKEFNFRVHGQNNQIAKLRLDTIYGRETWQSLEQFGDLCLHQDSKNKGDTVDGYHNLVSELTNPTGLTIRGIETFGFLEELLKRALEAIEANDHSMASHDKLNFHDVTDRIYDTIEKTVKGEAVFKKVIKPELVPGVKAMTIQIEEQVNGNDHTLKIPVNLGSDLPPRNNLKNLEGENPKIYLITWRESEVSIRYAFVIDCDCGQGIWSNHYADKLFINNP